MSRESTEKILGKYPGARRDKLIPILQEIQAENGFLTEEAMLMVGKHLHLPISKIFGIATFYDQFSFVPRGRFHLRLCNGTCCHSRGARELIREAGRILGLAHGETSKDGMFSLEVVDCLGACSRSPLVEINGEFYGLATARDLGDILRSIEQKERN